MMIKVVVLLLACVNALQGLETCSKDWKKVGCFHDYIHPERPLKFELLNRRDPFSDNYDGHLIDWKDYRGTLHALYCRCAELAKQKGYTQFGLQFYGECWSGPSADSRYNMYGKSDRCIGVDYDKCSDEEESECIGKDSTNYIYELIKDNTTSIVLDGGYSDWAAWSECSKSCGGGFKIRSRSCTSPVPSGDGKDCTGLGASEESATCSNHACKKVCKKAIDIGFLMDASSSVRRTNYNKIKAFIKDLSDDFTIGATETRFGIAHFSDRSRLDFTQRDTRYYDRTALKAKIDSIVYSYGGTRTDRALRMAEHDFFCPGCNPVGKPKVLVVITDGNTNPKSEDLTIASKSMKEHGVTIISLGIGPSISVDELKLIASKPHNNHVFKIHDFDQLKAQLGDILNRACSSTR